MLKQVLFGSVLVAASVLAVDASATPYYLRSASGLDIPADDTAMNTIFGSGAWTDLRYETAGTSFLDDANFVFLEGSSGSQTALQTFITGNQSTIESYVTNGGTLFINASPASVDLNLGFGVTVLKASAPITCTPTCVIGDVNDPVFGGVAPADLTFGGATLGEGHLETSGSFTSILKDNIGQILLARMNIGSGFVIFGSFDFTDDTQDLEDGTIGSTQPSDPGTNPGAQDPSTTPVPEPGTLALFGVGLAAMGASRWRRKKA
jgi:hypothetical protein